MVGERQREFPASRSLPESLSEEIHLGLGDAAGDNGPGVRRRARHPMFYLHIVLVGVDTDESVFHPQQVLHMQI